MSGFLSGLFKSGSSLAVRPKAEQVTVGTGTQVALSPAASRFLQQVGAPPRPAATGPRFLVSFDATESREETWSAARKIQGELFSLMESSGVAPLVRLTHFGGYNFQATEWTSDTSYLQNYMGQIDCISGTTQIEKVLDDAIGQTWHGKIAAVIYTGDTMEETHETLCDRANTLKGLGVPVYMFQEGDNAEAKSTYKQIAKITGGAYKEFKAGAFNDLCDLFKVVIATRSDNPTLLAAVRNDKSLSESARLLLSDLSKK